MLFAHPPAMDGTQELERLREQARRCRRLARDVSDGRTVQALAALAIDYDRQAAALELRLRALAGNAAASAA
jgi:hypothetical protein